MRHREHRQDRRFAQPDPGHDHDHGHRGGRHGMRGGRRGSRVFDHGELRLVVLALIAEAPRHGYELIKTIEDRLGGSYSPSPGVIYPTLTMLEELGHATVTESDGRKQHSITEEGRAWLAARQTEVDAALARMDGMGAAHGDGPAPQIVRAMENLRMALRLRLRGGPLATESVHRIAEALDATAIAIERS